MVIAVLAVSLLEALFILPAHLGHSSAKRPAGIGRYLHDLQQAFSRRFDRFLDRYYRPLLASCLRHRYITLSTALALLLVVAGFAYSDHMGIVNLILEDVRRIFQAPVAGPTTGEP